jgi:2'-5' RNA ligase
VAAVRDSVASSPGRDVRWVRLDGLHVTIRFLGATPIGRVPELAEACRATGAAVRRFDVAVSGAGAFPSEARPRAIWLGIGAGGDRLFELATELDRRLDPLGWSPQDRPFRAHLTLARSDGVRAGPTVTRALMAAIAGRVLPFQAAELVLFESQTGGGRATYVPRHRARLGG